MRTTWIGSKRRTGVAAAVAMVIVSACSGGDLDIDVDHQTSSPAPQPLDAAGPHPGRFEQSWQITVDDEPLAFHLISGQLVVATGSGAQAYDARTGEPTWRYREPGRELLGLAESDGAVVFESARIEAGGVDGHLIADEHLVGLDAGTGELLWENTDGWSLTFGRPVGSRLERLGDSADGVVVVETSSSGASERVGVEARTGEERWRVSDEEVADTCSEPSGDTDEQAAGPKDAGALVLAVLSCDASNDVAVGLDAESGELRWRRSLARADGVWATMRDGVTLVVADSGQVVLVGPDGQDLYVPEGEAGCPCDLYSAGDHVVIEYQERAQTRQPRLVSVDLDSGASISLSEPTGTVPGLVSTAEQSFYTVGTVNGNGLYKLLPWMVGITDVTSGDFTSAPLPVPTTEQPAWLGAAGERFFIATSTPGGDTAETEPTVVTSYTIAPTDGPAELGGVAPDEWPDPCGLLADAPRPQLELETETVERGGPVQVGRVTIPATLCTTWLPDMDTATVEVLWVAATDEEAAGLSREGELEVAGADEAWQDDQGRSTVLRVDRTMVIVTFAPDTPEPTRQTVLESVAANLSQDA